MGFVLDEVRWGWIRLTGLAKGRRRSYDVVSLSLARLR